MKNQEFESLEGKIYEQRKERLSAGSSFSVEQQFMLAFLFCLPSSFRNAIESNTTMQTAADLDVAMRVQVKLITGQDVQDGDFAFEDLWNPTTKNAITSDPRKVSAAFIFKYSTPPCPTKKEQDAIVHALLNANIPK